MITAIVSRAGINFATMPRETIEELVVKGGLAKYTDIVFQEEFATSLMFQTVLDGAFAFMGWAVYWIIARANKGQSLFTVRSLQSSSPALLLENQDWILNSLDYDHQV